MKGKMNTEIKKETNIIDDLFFGLFIFYVVNNLIKIIFKIFEIKIKKHKYKFIHYKQIHFFHSFSAAFVKVVFRDFLAASEK